LNGAERIRRPEEVMVQGMIHPVECGTELRYVAQRYRTAAGTSSGRGVLAVETRDLRARRSTCRGRGWKRWFMQRTGLFAVVNVA